MKFHFKVSERQSLVLYSLFFCIASILITRYEVYSENQALQLPLVHWLNNPELYPNDPFAETLRYYASTLWYAVAFGIRFIPLEPLLFILFVLERLLLFYAVGTLAHRFVPKSQLAIAGAMTIFALGLAGPTLGGNQLIINYFEQTGLAIAFYLLAFAAFYSQKPLIAALWVGLGFNCNSMFGVYTLTYFGGVFLIDGNYRRQWKQWLIAFGGFLLIASPAIFLTLSAFSQQALDSQLWYITSRARFPHHLFPLTWNKIEYGKYFVLLFLIATYLHQNRKALPSLYRSCLIWGGVSFLWLIYAFVAAYLTQSPSMLVMHPGRGLTLWYGVASIALVSVAAMRLETAKGTEKKTFRLGIFIASILLWHPIIGPYILTASFMGLATRPIWLGLFNRGSSQRIVSLLLGWVLLISIISVQTHWSQRKSLIDAIIQRPPQNIEEIALWAKANTATDQVFLVNYGLSWQQFRALSQRPAFMNWKDGSAILWNRGFVKPWTERLNAIGLDLTEKDLSLGKAVSKLNRLYNDLDDEQVKALKSQYKIDYWVIAADKPSDFPVLKEFKDFKIVATNQ